MKWGEWLVELFDENGTALAVFSGTEEQCNIWIYGVNTVLELMKIKNYIIQKRRVETF